MDLVIDVGNSETVLGLMQPEGLEVAAHWRVSTTVPRTVDEYELLLRELLAGRGFTPEDLGLTVLGSVVPSATGIISDTLARIGGGPPVVVTAQSPLPIELDVD